MEISLIPTPLSDTPPMTHSVTENLEDITIELQGLLTAIGIENIEDLAAPRMSCWRPITYAHAKLQFTQDIKRATTLVKP